MSNAIQSEFRKNVNILKRRCDLLGRNISLRLTLRDKGKSELRQKDIAGIIQRLKAQWKSIVLPC